MTVGANLLDDFNVPFAMLGIIALCHNVSVSSRFFFEQTYINQLPLSHLRATGAGGRHPAKAFATHMTRQQRLKEVSVTDFYDQFSMEYDRLALEHGWASPRIVFGLMYPVVEEGETIVDLGVGTGLCAELFKANGQKVIGIDLSAGMLDRCRQKAVCEQLIQHDLTHKPYPLDDHVADHIVANSVFYFIYDLRTPLAEISRIIKPGGSFCFNIECSSLAAGDSYLNNSNSVIATTVESDKAPRVYRHSEMYVCDLLDKFDFRLLHSSRYKAYHSPTTNKQVYFQIFLCKKG